MAKQCRPKGECNSHQNNEVLMGVNQFSISECQCFDVYDVLFLIQQLKVFVQNRTANIYNNDLSCLSLKLNGKHSWDKTLRNLTPLRVMAVNYFVVHIQPWPSTIKGKWWHGRRSLALMQPIATALSLTSWEMRLVLYTWLIMAFYL